MCPHYVATVKPERARVGQTDLQGLTWVGLAEAVLIWRPAGAFHWCTRAPCAGVHHPHVLGRHLQQPVVQRVGAAERLRGQVHLVISL